MSWCPPGAFIGEFDSFAGPSISYAFEYYTFKEGAGNSNEPCKITYVSSKVILGENVASGALHPSYSDYMRSVASRVLTSNEDHEENIIFQDIGCPCVSSISFCLPDILARGEKRSFCLVFLHPYYSKMLSQWPLIATCSRIFIQDYCLEAANERYTLEYSTFPDLEQCREEAHRTSLRPFEELIKRKDEQLFSTFTRIHCFFEIVLPLLFSKKPLFNFPSSQFTEDMNGILKERIIATIEELIPQAALRVCVVNQQSEKPKCEIEASAQSVLPRQVMVKPLTVWLLEFLESFPSDQGNHLQLHILLNTLFSGDQIIIFGENASSCASLALAMSYMLPSELVRTKLFSDAYLMPYESQIVSFSSQFLSEWEIVPFRDSAYITDGKRLFVLAEIEADGVVGVRIRKGGIDQVFYCDDLPRRVASLSPSSPSACRSAEVPHPHITTLSCRIMGLLQTYRTDLSTYPSSNDGRNIEVEITSIKLLTAQIMQLVSEYALRGSVYLKLFREQEIMLNKALLQRRASSRDTSLLSKIYQPLRRILVANTLQSGLSLETADISDFPNFTLQKNPSLRVETDKRYDNEQFLFFSSSPEDHNVLIFLGSQAIV